MNIPIGEWSGSNATSALHNTIKLQIEAMDRQTASVARLSRVLLLLAVIQTAAAVVQIVPIIHDWVVPVLQSKK